MDKKMTWGNYGTKWEYFLIFSCKCLPIFQDFRMGDFDLRESFMVP